jgi:hypothetical protein
VKRAQPEHRLQCEIVQFLRLRGYFVAHVPNGAQIAGTGKQRAMRVGFLKSAGMTPGMPDLYVSDYGGRCGWIEVKAEGAYQQPTQRAVQSELEARGQRYAVCRSLDDVEETLAEWGWITPLRAPDGAKLRPVPPYIADTEAEAVE